MRRPDGRALLAGVAVVIAATIGAALLVAGSPGAQRAARMDERRVEQLQRIDAAIVAHARQHDALPATLDGLAEATGRELVVVDPIGGQPYGYVVEAPDRYRLCAGFDTDSYRDGDRARAPEGWAHPAGGHCFERRLGAGSGKGPDRAD